MEFGPCAIITCHLVVIFIKFQTDAESKSWYKRFIVSNSACPNIFRVLNIAASAAVHLVEKLNSNIAG